MRRGVCFPRPPPHHLVLKGAHERLGRRRKRPLSSIVSLGLRAGGYPTEPRAGRLVVNPRAGENAGPLSPCPRFSGLFVFSLPLWLRKRSGLLVI